MARPSKEFIKSLSDFTSALEAIVDVLYDQINSEDDIGEMFTISKQQTETMAKMAESIVLLTNDSKVIRHDTTEILKTLKSIQQRENRGIIDRITDDKDKSKIVSGVETIRLIAGGILAIGLAFKVLGDVDIETVVSISLALPLIAYAFDKIGSIEGLTIGKVTTVAAGVVLMSAGLVLASHFLNMTPEISAGKFLTLAAVSATLAIMSYGYANILESLDGVTYGDLFKAAISLPLMAAGIVASAMIFGLLGSVDFDYLGIIMFSGTLAISATIMALPIWVLDKLGITPVGALEGSLSIVAIAGGIMVSSLLLQMGTYDNTPDLSWTLNTAVALGAFGIGAALIGMAGPAGLLSIGIGVAGMAILAGGLLLIDSIISNGDFTGEHSLEWAQSLGMWMLALVPSALILGNPIALLMAGIATATFAVLAKGLVTIADIVRGGDFTGGPSKQWSEGIGTALVLFGNALNNISPGLFSSETTDQKVEAMIKMASSLKGISMTVKGGDYTGGPSKDWAEGIGTALVLFGNALNNIKDDGFWSIFSSESSDDRVNALIKLASSLKEISTAVKGGDYTGGPSEAWTKGSAQSILAFAQAMGVLQDSGIDSDDLAEWIQVSPLLGTGLAGVANSIAAGNYTVYPSQEWNDGINTMFSIYTKSVEMKDQIEEGMEVFESIGESIPGISSVMRRLHYAIGGGQSISESVSEMEKLNRVYNDLATSIKVLAESLSTLSVDNMPNFRSLTNGLIALSVIDSDDLEDVLDVMSEKSEDISTLFSKISEASDDNVDKLFGEDGSKTGVQSLPQITQPQAPQQQINQNAKMEKLLADINNVLNKILTEVDGVNDKPPVIASSITHK